MSSSPAPDPNPGPISMLLHSPVLHKESPDSLFLDTLVACFSGTPEDHSAVARWRLVRRRHVWDAQIAAGDYAAHWKDLVERDMRIADAILDDPSHLQYFCGMRKRVLLQYLLIELDYLVYSQPAPDNMAPMPNPPLVWPTPTPAASASTSASTPVLDAKVARG